MPDLSAEERRNLRDLLTKVLSEDEALWHSNEHLFSEDTLDATEKFLTQCTACTKRMQKLFLDLAGGLTRGLVAPRTAEGRKGSREGERFLDRQCAVLCHRQVALA